MAIDRRLWRTDEDKRITSNERKNERRAEIAPRRLFGRIPRPTPVESGSGASGDRGERAIAPWSRPPPRRWSRPNPCVGPGRGGDTRDEIIGTIITIITIITTLITTTVWTAGCHPSDCRPHVCGQEQQAA